MGLEVDSELAAELRKCSRVHRRFLIEHYDLYVTRGYGGRKGT